MELVGRIQAQGMYYRGDPTVVAEASLLARKWQDKVGSFQEVRKWALELVPELGPSFEEEKEEKVQEEEKKKEEKEDKGKQQLLLEAAKESST
jgi:hypothetical protein